eukprot:3986649-Alexandrium_andersonii.AAC.1
MVKVASGKTRGRKLTGSWMRGVWCGKAELNDAHLVSTDKGAVAARAIYRLPSGTRVNAGMVKDMVGTPWDFTDGVTHTDSSMLQLPAQGPAQPAPEVHARFREDGHAYPTPASGAGGNGAGASHRQASPRGRT